MLSGAGGARRVRVRVRPGAAKTRFVSRMSDGSYKIDVGAEPVKGKANKELLRFFSTEFGCDRRSVRLLSGVSGRIKVVLIEAPDRIPAWL
ncbi:DUF167 domain-containing protein [Candidatus Fermentibacteria bacterium]|nr:DUF167 domain-containing protein [Candidatus Fermentibacteria bacterium]